MRRPGDGGFCRIAPHYIWRDARGPRRRTGEWRELVLAGRNRSGHAPGARACRSSTMRAARRRAECERESRRRRDGVGLGGWAHQLGAGRAAGSSLWFLSILASCAVLPEGRRDPRVIVRGWVGRRPRLCSASRAPQVYLHPEGTPLRHVTRRVSRRRGPLAAEMPHPAHDLAAPRVSRRASMSCSLCAAGGREYTDG